MGRTANEANEVSCMDRPKCICGPQIYVHIRNSNFFSFRFRMAFCAFFVVFSNHDF